MTPRASRVIQVWQVLISKASNHQSVTYGGVAEATGLMAAGLGRYLDDITNWCAERGTPALTVIVVSAATGRPSEVPSGVDDVDMERERVFNYQWYRETPPHPDELHP